uniref:Uncharacterized protein n=1 Tax=Globodera rostochiensis TaxID=31243 RepID=A0A914HBR9_GLORO
MASAKQISAQCTIFSAVITSVPTLQMEMARRNEPNSSRRPQQRRLNNAENSSDIDGTAHRVASVTLNNTESDSRTSADLPTYSLRSKRRKKLPRREKQAVGAADMEVDEHQPPWKKLSVNTTDNGPIPTCKVQMDWEHDQRGDQQHRTWRIISPISFHCQTQRTAHQTLMLTMSKAIGPEMNSHVVRHFRPLSNSDDSELLLDKVYRTSAVKQMLRRQSVVANVQIVKRGRGTVALKKL